MLQLIISFATANRHNELKEKKHPLSDKCNKYYFGASCLRSFTKKKFFHQGKFSYKFMNILHQFVRKKKRKKQKRKINNQKLFLLVKCIFT